jgi:hypothetical protein
VNGPPHERETDAVKSAPEVIGEICLARRIESIPKERTREKAQECDNACLPPINTHSEI